MNPTLALGVYPVAYTQFTTTLAGLPAGSSNGRLAFRYFVTDGGTGANSDIISIDDVTIVAGGPTAPIFTYTPPAASTVTFTGGTMIGSTGTASIAVSVATAGAGVGAGATTTTTCTAPTAPFAGFAETVSAIGNGAITGSPLTGSCTLGAAIATQTLTCSENRGGTPTAVTFTLSCPAGTASADLGITKTDGVTTVIAGGSATYTIVASNAGPAGATGATVADNFPAGCASVAWTCTGAGGGTCTASGAGNIGDTVNLPSGGSVTYTATCTISGAATGTLANTATVTAPVGVTDPTPGNNSATDTDTIATDVPPVFAYTPLPGAVTLTGGTTIGSTGSASIAVAIGTAGIGSGAAATTTTTCTAPGGFAGFTQTVSAVGPAATTSGGPLTGTCVLGAAPVMATMTCNEVQGSTTVPRLFNLTCPAGTAVPLTSTPISGSTVTMPQQTLNNPATTSVISFQNPGLAAATVTCTAPTATEFTVNPLMINVPASGNGSTTVSFSSAIIGTFTGVLNCSAGAQTFTFNLTGTTGLPATAVPVLGEGMRQLMLLAMLAMGLIAVGVYTRRS